MSVMKRTTKERCDSLLAGCENWCGFGQRPFVTITTRATSYTWRPDYGTTLFVVEEILDTMIRLAGGTFTDRSYCHNHVHHYFHGKGLGDNCEIIIYPHVGYDAHPTITAWDSVHPLQFEAFEEKYG